MRMLAQMRMIRIQKGRGEGAFFRAWDGVMLYGTSKNFLNF